MRSIYDRYKDDPVFKSLVDSMVTHIEQLNLTPTEIREAAMLAQIVFESRNPRPVTFSLREIVPRG